MMSKNTAARRCAAAAILVLTFFAIGARPGSTIDVKFETEAARTVIELIARGNVTEAEAERVAKLPGIAAVIRKANGFDPAATEAAWKAGFRAASTGAPLGADPFRFARVKERLQPTRALLARIDANPKEITAEIAKRVAAYAPEGITFDATVQVVVTGTSDGWVPARGVFYVAIDYFQGDYDGLLLICAHELYHLAQATFMAAPVPAGAVSPNTSRLLYALVQEGTASFMADPRAVKGAEYITWFRGKYDRNFARIGSNFALLETLLYRARNDAEANYNSLYTLGFTGTWDSPLYFVGYRIAEQIEKYDGRPALVALMQRSPAELVMRYVQLYREKPDDKNFVRFTPAVERIVEELARAK